MELAEEARRRLALYHREVFLSTIQEDQTTHLLPVIFEYMLSQVAGFTIKRHSSE